MNAFLYGPGDPVQLSDIVEVERCKGLLFKKCYCVRGVVDHVFDHTKPMQIKGGNEYGVSIRVEDGGM